MISLRDVELEICLVGGCRHHVTLPEDAPAVWLAALR
jgi:hypothetical protein